MQEKIVAGVNELRCEPSARVPRQITLAA